MKNLWDNELENGLKISKIIMSWIHAGGIIVTDPNSDFRKWLRTFLNEEEVVRVCFIASHGYDELEGSASKFLKSKDART